MSEIIVAILALCWIPTVVGLFRLWNRYLTLLGEVTSPDDLWLLRLFCWIASLITPVVVYISVASSLRMLGQPPLEWGPLFGAISALIIAAIVPLIEYWLARWIKGDAPDPVVVKEEARNGS